MPAKKAYRKKRNYKKKSKTMSKKLAKLSQLVYKTIEPKQLTTAFNVTIGSQSWTAISLTDFTFNNLPGQGVTNQQRIGNSVMLTGISLKMNFQQLSNFYNIRVLIVQFPQKVGVANPSDPARFLTFGTPQGTPANRSITTMSPYAVGANTKFTILHDSIVSASDLGVDTPNQNYAIQHKKNIYVKPKSNVLEFPLTSAGAVSPFPNKNQINLYMINDYPDLAGGYNSPVNGIFRIKFRDA